MVFQKWHFKNLFLCLSGLILVQQSFLFLPSSFLKLCLAVSSSPVPACTVLFWTMPSGSLCLTSIWTCIITGINGVPTLSNMNLVPGRFFSIGLCPTDGMFWDSWSMGCYSTVWISYGFYNSFPQVFFFFCTYSCKKEPSEDCSNFSPVLFRFIYLGFYLLCSFHLWEHTDNFC